MENSTSNMCTWGATGTYSCQAYTGNYGVGGFGSTYSRKKVETKPNPTPPAGACGCGHELIPPYSTSDHPTVSREAFQGGMGGMAGISGVGGMSGVGSMGGMGGVGSLVGIGGANTQKRMKNQSPVTEGFIFMGPQQHPSNYQNQKTKRHIVKVGNTISRRDAPVL